MALLEVIASTLPGRPDPAVPIAASRAGGLGVLDLQFIRDEALVRQSLDRLCRYGRAPFGLKVDRAGFSWLAGKFPTLLDRPGTLILASPWSRPDLLKVQRLRQKGIRVLAECTCFHEARIAEEAGLDGVIAKGNEAAGFVGSETTFILVQRFVKNLSIPVYAQGGIGLHTGSACYAAGARGVVLDSQLLLARESSLPEDLKTRLSALDGSETTCLGAEIGKWVRVCGRFGSAEVRELEAVEESLAGRENMREEDLERAWIEAVASVAASPAGRTGLLFLGQDVGLAATLARRYVTVGGIVHAVGSAPEAHLRTAARERPLAEGAPLARSLGIRYPIFQGPMARISDVPEFSRRVAEAGALSFVAVGWTSGPELEALLAETRKALSGKPWGVGLLGFLPPEAYRNQVAIVEKHKPPFALIAGGRPDQAKSLEAKGIPAFVHVPSPGLLRIFLDSGLRRFVFEGREAGGHVGPLCSFVLWEQAIEGLAGWSPSDPSNRPCQAVFAGGIHDALSASMVAVMAAPLAERGIQVGVQMGSAYLFTKEAVSTGAIVEDYQREALSCSGTGILETGVGHAVRCMETPYARFFRSEKRRLALEGKSAKELQETLERMNTGRLRVATKGIARKSGYGTGPEADGFVSLSETERREQGLYMIGQLAAIRDRVSSIEELHADVSAAGSERIEALERALRRSMPQAEKEKPSDVAIVGMACVLPKAQDLRTYWSNILHKVSAIGEVPESRWASHLYYDEDPKAADKVYSKWGAFIDPVPFDPVKYGMPPNSLRSIEPLQLLVLEVASKALEDAGYGERPFARERTSVILGISGTGELGQAYAFRSALPAYFGSDCLRVTEHFEGDFPEWTEDSFPGILVNVAAGRVANRLDLGGTNFTVDAACASSLAALYLAVRELECRTSDMVVVGGADTMQNPFTYLCFAKTQALSPRGRCCPLDQSADGIVLGEGIATVVLKRLEDAERDGDRIYAVIKAVAAGSDGRDKSLTAPRIEGQIRTLERAYAKAGIAPATVALVEAHATGTEVGDQAEIEALSRFLARHGAAPQSCAVGSVKSMIGHTKSTAGIAGLIKTALALHDKILPPTLGVEKPNKAFLEPKSPIYPNTEPRPWLRCAEDPPRRAGVSAFGFGGTNFHAVLEEYDQDSVAAGEGFFRALAPNRSSELFLWARRTAADLSKAVQALRKALERAPRISLSDLAFTVTREFRKASASHNGPWVRLAVIADSLEDLGRKLDQASQALCAADPLLWDPRGVYFTGTPLNGEGKLAFLFPGQGSQYPNMLADLAAGMPAVRELFERSDALLRERLEKRLSRYVFPPPAWSKEEEQNQRQELALPFVAQPAIGTASLALYHLLSDLGLRPHMLAGHSYGEYVALCVAGVMSEKELIELSEIRGRLMAGNGNGDSGVMAALRAGVDQVSDLLSGIDEVWIANLNEPEQTVISGTRPAVDRVLGRCRSLGIPAKRLPVGCGFHSPLVSGACEKLKETLRAIDLRPPKRTVFSNVSAAPYPDDPKAVAEHLAYHLRNRVDFIREVEAMYEHGARIFVEVGPGKVLTGLVERILRNRPHLAVSSNQKGRPGLEQILHLIGQISVHGIAVEVDKLFAGRPVKAVDLADPALASPLSGLSPTTWIVSGGRAVPVPEALRGGLEKKPPPMKISADNRAAGTGSGASLDAQRAAARPNLSAGEEKTFGHEGSGRPLAPQAKPSSAGGASASPDRVAAQAVARFQDLMDRFLVTQKEVMLAYLRGRARIPAALPDTRPADTDETASKRRLDAAAESFGSRTSGPVGPGASEEDRSKVAAEVSAGPSGLDELRGSQAEPESAAAEILSPQKMEALLLDLVSERTGYPRDMLGLDVDLEADLGIDSIKRIEILGSMIRLCATGPGETAESEMEGVGGIRTLRGMLEWLEEKFTPSGRGEAPERTSEPFERPLSPLSQQSSQPCVQAEEVPRFVLRAVPRPVELPLEGKGPDGAILMTEDGLGVAEALSASLSEKGLRIVRVRLGRKLEPQPDGSFLAALDSPEGVSELADAVRTREGPLAGVIHLLPLRDSPRLDEMELTDWRAQVRQDVKSLFYLFKEIDKDSHRAGRRGSPLVLGATGMGGDFACGAGAVEPALLFCPAQAGVAGFLKSLAAERPGMRVKVVDLDPRQPASDLADHLAEEIFSADRLIEVGYKGRERVAIEVTPAALAASCPGPLRIDSESVVLVTGGARGITADVALELARRYRPTLVLVGRSCEPEPEEALDTAGLATAREIKSAIIARMRGQGQTVRLAEVEAMHKGLLAEREMRENFRRMRQAGARVEYVQADVRDGDRFGEVIEEVYRTHGRLDGVIHGAGIIEDKRIDDKTAESFDRVVDTKADSGFILARRLHFESLKFLVFFTSVAGRFGNIGQADYAAANEILNKLAACLDRAWPGRVVAVNWGPWDRESMVTPEVRKQFADRGIRLVPRHIGPSKLCEEIERGSKGEAEIVLGAFDGWGVKTPSEPAARPATACYPLTGRENWAVLKREGTVEFTRLLDPEKDLFLRDHRIDGNPVLPAAFAMEMMAEVAAQNWPGMEVAGLSNISVLRGIVLKNGPETVLIEVSPETGGISDQGALDLKARIAAPGSKSRPYYEATVHLRRSLAPAPLFEAVHGAALKSFPLSVDEAYRKWLFHGPALQCIASIEGLNEEGIVATVVPSVPADCIQEAPPGDWLIDPVVVDSGFQLAILWARARHDFTPLPSRFRAYRRYGPLAGERIRCFLRIHADPGSLLMRTDLYFVAPDGRVLGKFERAESTCSRALNTKIGLPGA